MEQYIPKSALVAWAKEAYLCENASMIRKVCYKQLVEHLDTLEVKEVNLEKELNIYLEKVKKTDEDIVFKDFAKHFFELGMNVSNKAQKGE